LLVQGIVLDQTHSLTAQVYNYPQEGDFKQTNYKELLNILNMLDSPDIDITKLQPLRIIGETARDIYIVWNGPLFRHLSKDPLNLN
jgi:hypothetical protein